MGGHFQSYQAANFIGIPKDGQNRIPTIHDVECAGFYADLVEDVHIVNFSVSDDDYGRDTPPEIQKRVELDRPFVFSEFRPGEKRQTEMDCGRIQRVDGVRSLFQRSRGHRASAPLRSALALNPRRYANP